MNRRVFIIAGFVVVLLPISFFGAKMSYGYYWQMSLQKALSQPLQADQVALSQFINIEKNNQKMSFAELDAAAEKHLEAREELETTIASTDFGPHESAKPLLLNLLRSEKDFVRAKRAYYRSVLEAAASIEYALSHSDDMREQMKSAYSVEMIRYYGRSALKALSEAAEKQKVLVTTSDELLDSASLVQSSWSDAEPALALLGAAADSDPMAAYLLDMELKKQEHVEADQQLRASLKR